MLSEALRLPYRAADATGTLIVGAVLTGLSGLAVVGWLGVLLLFPRVGAVATPLVVLVPLVVRGYLLRVVAAGITDTATAPSFVQWGSLLRNGLKSLVVAAVYALPGVGLAGIAGGAAASTVVPLPRIGELSPTIAGLVVTVSGVGLLWYAVGYFYLRGAARAVLAASGSLRAALDPRRVVGVAWSGSYLGGWLAAIGVLLLAPLVVAIPLVAAVAAGFYDPVLAAIGVLATGVVGIGLWFSLRMSAAWATGRGAAPELARSDPLVLSHVSTPEMSSTTIDDDSGLSDHISEASPQVQTGRPVHPPSESEEPPASDDGDGAGDAIDFGMPEPMPADGDAQTAERDAAGDAAGDATDDDGAFEWSMDEAQT